MRQNKVAKVTSSRLRNARRDVVVLAVLIIAVMLLIWNGSAFFHRLPMADANFGPEIRLASTALTLNVALILFGWRRYVDLQHEAEMRAEHERRAVVLATTDAITGLYNRKGFADYGGQLCADAAERGDNVVVISFQVHRFKTVTTGDPVPAMATNAVGIPPTLRWTLKPSFSRRSSIAAADLSSFSPVSAYSQICRDRPSQRARV